MLVIFLTIKIASSKISDYLLFSSLSMLCSQVDFTRVEAIPTTTSTLGKYLRIHGIMMVLFIYVNF